eukprot:TRINITY_DN19595_c0_g1_i3.p1 TRINITY_DN19595_c0_g1~~TRINITY_DN19595_c0_g1_i3.p1  ORF type:complete len:172 (-),score=39.23 TRINITY_DN19595_c0_g1_i3:180-638(-)
MCIRDRAYVVVIIMLIFIIVVVFLLDGDLFFFMKRRRTQCIFATTLTVGILLGVCCFMCTIFLLTGLSSKEPCPKISPNTYYLHFLYLVGIMPFFIWRMLVFAAANFYYFNLESEIKKARDEEEERKKKEAQSLVASNPKEAKFEDVKLILR